jgi:hypothetical protein
VQVHHIDDDPSNNDPDNLAVLCFDHHRDTQITGGFDRKLSAGQIRLYRDDWLVRVARRRAGDEVPPSLRGRAAPVHAANQEETELPPVYPEEQAVMLSLEESGLQDLAELIRGLPRRRLEAYRAAQPMWDTGVTITMKEGNWLVSDALRGMLRDLARFYPEGHFGDEGPTSRRWRTNWVTGTGGAWSRTKTSPALCIQCSSVGGSTTS